METDDNGNGKWCCSTDGGTGMIKSDQQEMCR